MEKRTKRAENRKTGSTKQQTDVAAEDYGEAMEGAGFGFGDILVELFVGLNHTEGDAGTSGEFGLGETGEFSLPFQRAALGFAPAGYDVEGGLGEFA